MAMHTSQTHTESIKISGYNMITDNRTFRTGGGVFVYHLRDDLKIDGIKNILVDTQDLLLNWRYL